MAESITFAGTAGVGSVLPLSDPNLAGLAASIAATVEAGTPAEQLADFMVSCKHIISDKSSDDQRRADAVALVSDVSKESSALRARHSFLVFISCFKSNSPTTLPIFYDIPICRLLCRLILC